MVTEAGIGVMPFEDGGRGYTLSHGGLKNTLFSPVCILTTGPTVGMVGNIYIPRTVERVRSF